MSANEWRLTHPANVRPGDQTLIGTVESVELFGALGFAVVTVAGREFTRHYAPAGWLDVAIGGTS